MEAFFKRFSFVVIALTLHCLTGYGASTTLFSTYGPNYTTNTEATQIISYDYWVATPFTPTNTAPLGRIIVTYYSWQPPYQIRFTLAADTNGLPGPALETWSYTIPDSVVLMNMDSTNNPMLTNGVQYWLIASADNSGTSSGWYMTPTPNLYQTSWASKNQGASWSLRTGATIPDGAFEVDALNPLILGMKVAGTNATLTATNGYSGRTYVALTTTNLMTPLKQWAPVATNQLKADGGFIVPATNAVPTKSAQQYFILEMQ